MSMSDLSAEHDFYFDESQIENYNDAEARDAYFVKSHGTKFLLMSQGEDASLNSGFSIDPDSE